jgi:hypothetical protein
MRCLRLSFAAVTISLLILAGCRKPEITTYTAPKDVAPAMPGLAPAAQSNTSGLRTASAASAAPAIRWQLPAGWQDQGANNIRLGNILVTDANNQRAEMTVTRFEGDVGSDLANVNRWRGQLQLAPIDEATLSQAIVHHDFPAGHMDIVDLVSDAPLAGSTTKTRMLVAWLKQPDATWFFKLTGADSLVAAQRDAFTAFLGSVEFSAASATQASSALPAGHPPITSDAVSNSPAQPTSSSSPASSPGSSPAASAPTAPPMSMAGASLPSTAVSSGNALLWTAPAGWTEKPLGPVRKGSFAVRAPAIEGEADLSITAFPGDVGGLLANLNRWRGELQLEPLTQADLPTASTTAPAADPALRFIVVDFAGTPGGTATRTLGAILPIGTDTYFFKLKGPDAVVADQKAAFLGFLATVKTR